MAIQRITILDESATNKPVTVSVGKPFKNRKVTSIKTRGGFYEVHYATGTPSSFPATVVWDVVK